jgi:hypothetical protein
MDTIAFPIDKKFRSFKPTSEHERKWKSNESWVEDEDGLLKYITIDKRIPQQSVDQIRQYVFDKMKETPGGKARLRTWADEADTRDKETRKNPRRFQDAVTAIDHPKPDPFKAFSRNITLDVFANQVLHMGVIENSNAKESVEALNELEKVLTQSTDLNDKDQTRELRNAL